MTEDSRGSEDDDARLVPVILCGGAGTRLWPMSRAEHPKPFLALNAGPTLYQQALLRVADAHIYAPPMVVAGRDHESLVADQAAEAGVPLGMVLLEPSAHGTAAAIAAAALAAAETGNRTLHVLPSDHEIVADDAYSTAVRRAASAARATDALVAFGIAPFAPETGYGYIRAGEAAGDGAARIDRFIEKPHRRAAEAMIAAGGHYWNAGMFVFSCGAFLSECRRHAPDVAGAAQAAYARSLRDASRCRLDPDAYALAPEISVDYAVFEKTGRALVVPAAITWRDLGTWDAVWRAGSKDAAGNLVCGPATVNEATNALVVSDGPKVVVQGLDDVVVVATSRGVLVTRRSDAQAAAAPSALADP